MSEGRQHYKNLISDYPVLSREEVDKLYEQMSYGGEALRKLAREKMIHHNLRLVIKIVYRYRLSEDAYDDAIQEGNQGLMRAVDKFDPSMGYAFSTYADRWIRYRISQYVSSLYSPAHVPADMQKLNSKVKRAQLELARQHEESQISAKMISDYLDVPVSDVERSLSLSQSAVQMDAPLGGDGGLVGDFYTYAGEDDELSRVETEILTNQVKERILSISEGRERDMVCRAYGIGCEDQTYKEIGESYHLTRERVRQIVEGIVNRAKALVVSESTQALKIAV